MKYICFAAVMISLTGCVNSSGVLPMGPDRGPLGKGKITYAKTTF